MQWPKTCPNPLRSKPRKTLPDGLGKLGLGRGVPGVAAALALSACADMPAQSSAMPGFWWFACLALLGLAGLGYVLGRQAERRARAAEVFQARSLHAALLATLEDPVWRTDAQHRWAPASGLPGAAAASAAADVENGATGTPPPPAWFSHPGLRPLLEARRGFQRLQLSAAEGATAAAQPLAVDGPAAWWLSGQPVLDHDGHFAGFLGTARPAEAASLTVPVPSPAAPAAATQPPAFAAGPTSAQSEKEEAETFNLTVVHDLRAPVRVVDGFTRIVKEDYGPGLDRVANDHLDRVLSAAARMNRMIDALLTLANLSNQPLSRQPVDMSQMALDVVDELRRSQPGRAVEVSIEAGLQVMADPTLLRQVLENLLGNAWKYSGRSPKAQIALASVKHGSGRAFVVRDNGAGFDMRSAARLFGVFQRLHSASEFPGNGVGLASVRRIVRRHGGDIWAEAEPARGAAFTFTLADT